MQKVEIIQKKVTINYAQYTNNFVRHTLPSGEVQDLEVIEFDESGPFDIEIVLSDTEVPTLEFDSIATIKVNKIEAQSRAGSELYEGGVSDSYAWIDLTTVERMERCLPELEAYFNQVLV